MLLRLFKYNSPPAIIFIIFLMILLWLRPLIDPVPPDTVTTMPLYEMLFGTLQQNAGTSALISIAIYTLLIILILRLNLIHFLLEDRTYMPAIFFIMLIATYPSALQLSQVLVSVPFLLGALLMLIRGEEHRAEPLSLFNASLVLAAGSLFYLKILWFIPFLWITATIIRPLKWRGIINPILALAMLLLFAVTYYWVFRDDLSLLRELVEKNLTLSREPLPAFGTPVLILTGYLLMLIIIASIHLLSRFQVRKIIIRKLYLVMFILFIYSCLFFLLVSGFRTEVMVIVAVPVAYLFSNFFFRRRNHWIHELLIWVWLGLIAWVHLAPVIHG
jgi:hypothetical protein